MQRTNRTFFTYQTPRGMITLESDGSALTRVVFGQQVLNGIKKPTELTNQAASELQEYFAGKRFAFSVPLNPEGTPFQKVVWEALLTIPYGETRTYKQIAEQIGHPQSYRAVGGANNKNPLPIFIPCHRVIGTDGSLTGYASGTKIKEGLLLLEQHPHKNE